MSDILNKTIVLVLNRNWQAIHVRTPQEAFCMMATNVATALENDGDDNTLPPGRTEGTGIDPRQRQLRLSSASA